MKRLFAILGLVAAMALSVGVAAVLADEGGSQGDNNAACTTPGATGSGDESGDAGNDSLNGGKGNDVLSGGPGNDRINARDGHTDRINCGRGNDRVKADGKDKVARNCEHVSRSK